MPRTPAYDMLRLIRRGLEAAGLCDPTAPAASAGMRWSEGELARLAIHRMTREELDYLAGHGPTDIDPLRAVIASHVVGLFHAAEAIKEAA